MTPLGNSAILVKSYIPNNGGKRLEGADLHFKEERYDENLRCTTLDKKATLRYVRVALVLNCTWIDHVS